MFHIYIYISYLFAPQPNRSLGVLRRRSGGLGAAVQLALLSDPSGSQPSTLHTQLHAARGGDHERYRPRVSPENHVGVLPRGERAPQQHRGDEPMGVVKRVCVLHVFYVCVHVCTYRFDVFCFVSLSLFAYEFFFCFSVCLCVSLSLSLSVFHVLVFCLCHTCVFSEMRAQNMWNT